MFKIGDLSRLSRLSVKTLRYYDELGLLKPSQVDEFTGYRYYSACQLPRIHRIVVLKGLGLSLDQIAQLLDEELPADQIRGMLRLKRLEIQQRITEEQERLAQLEVRLKQIEQEGKMPSYDIVLKRIEPQTVAAIRETVPTYGDQGRLFGEIYTFLSGTGARPAGPPIAVYHDREYKERDVDLEVIVPVSGQFQSDGRIACLDTPAIDSVAAVVYQGGYEAFCEPYDALMAWLESHGYRICGPNREIHIQGPKEGIGPESFVTEIQFPVEKA